VTERPGSTRLDLFLDESQTGASAFVFAFAPAPGSSQDALIRQSLALRQKPGTQYKRLGVRPVGDTQALIVLYAEQRDDGVWQAVRQAVFMQGGTGWVVAVAAPTAEATSYEPVLDLMLDGFRLTAAQQP
jgi:hypothetical protein